MIDDPNYLSRLLPDVQEEFEKTLRRERYKTDPVLWGKDVLGVDIWEKQVDIAMDLACGDKKSIAVRAGHGVGKSFIAAFLVCWWIDTHPIQRVFVASTAPSADQVGAILWREIRKFWSLSHKRYAEYLRAVENGEETDMPDHPLPGRITGDNKWKDDLGNLIGHGRKPPDNKEDSFQGIHDGYVLAIGDEACGLLGNMIDDLSNITSNAKSRRLLIGNPTNPRSRFGEIFLDDTPRTFTDEETGEEKTATLQDVWSLHHISVLDSPNFHGGGICKCERHRGMPRGLGMPAEALENLTDLSYVVEKKAEYGEDSSRYKARVLGEFAYDEGNNLFTDDILGKGFDAKVFTEGEGTTVWLGMDVARSINGDWSYLYSFTQGELYELDDETAAPLRLSNEIGGKLRLVDRWRGVPLVDTISAEGEKQVGQATLVHQHALNLGASEVRVDSGGLGVGFIDGLKKLAWGHYRVIEMQSGGPTPDSRAWHRNRDYQFDHLAKRMQAGLIDIDRLDKVLVQQLGDITYEFIDPHGAMKIESKREMKKRGVKSPDAADAAWYAAADLRHLDGPQDGDTVHTDPNDVVERGMESGFYDDWQMAYTLNAS
ncbi:hypothetical protein [Agromyces sp. NPDC058104]|uniref:hypothetical protein n=1 Tax=Agromyces sp. NPDC058104 TaxID=3346342 RepID=UPI0036DD3E0D